MASEWEEMVELDDVQLATVVGGTLKGYAGGVGLVEAGEAWLPSSPLWLWYPIRLGGPICRRNQKS